jgi:hypothetical protein
LRQLSEEEEGEKSFVPSFVLFCDGDIEFARPTVFAVLLSPLTMFFNDNL